MRRGLVGGDSGQTRPARSPHRGVVGGDVVQALDPAAGSPAAIAWRSGSEVTDNAGGLLSFAPAR
jgi:hypothetical protein